MRYHTCFVRHMQKQTSLQFATFETRVLCEYTSQEFCKVTAYRSHAVHRSMYSPDPSICLQGLVLPQIGGAQGSVRSLTDSCSVSPCGNLR